MPIYDFRCEKCKKVEEDFAQYEERTKACSCGGKMTRLIRGTHSISMNGVPPGGYYDENLGTYIGSVSQKRRVMEQQGVTEKFGKGWA